MTKNLILKLKTVKKPLFGGNFHKRIKMYFETKIKNEKRLNQDYNSDKAIKIYLKRPFFESLADNHDALMNKLGLIN
jgi:hypothetical protein